MIIRTAVTSCTLGDGDKYVQYLPLCIKAWDRLGVKVAVEFVCPESKLKYYEKFVKQFNCISEFVTYPDGEWTKQGIINLAQTSRFWLAARYNKFMCSVITDIDMLPISKKHFDVSEFSGYDYVHLNYAPYRRFMDQWVEQLPACYHVANTEIFRKYHSVDSTPIDYYVRLLRNYNVTSNKVQDPESIDEYMTSLDLFQLGCDVKRRTIDCSIRGNERLCRFNFDSVKKFDKLIDFHMHGLPVDVCEAKYKQIISEVDNVNSIK